MDCCDVSCVSAAGDRSGCLCGQAEQGQGVTGAANGGGRGMWENGKDAARGKQESSHEEIWHELDVIVGSSACQRGVLGSQSASTIASSAPVLLFFDVF